VLGFDGERVAHLKASGATGHKQDHVGH
jgi:hypothetical protein